MDRVTCPLALTLALALTLTRTLSQPFPAQYGVDAVKKFLAEQIERTVTGRVDAAADMANGPTCPGDAGMRCERTRSQCRPKHVTAQNRQALAVEERNDS